MRAMGWLLAVVATSQVLFIAVSIGGQRATEKSTQVGKRHRYRHQIGLQVL